MAETLSSQTVLVTGGAKGVGAEIARSFAAQGAELLLLGRDSSRLSQFQATLAEAGANVHTYVCDLSDEEQITATTRRLEQEGRQVSVLVNNAGVAESSPFIRADMAQWDRAMTINARAPAQLSAQLLEGMRKRGYGRIINVGSVVSLEGARYVSAYAASKHALLGWARCLALELQGSGVTVNTICPGYIDTPIFAKALTRSLPQFDHDEARAKAAILKSAGQSRLLSVQEVAQWVLHLAQDPGTLNGEAIRLCP